MSEPSKTEVTREDGWYWVHVPGSVFGDWQPMVIIRGHWFCAGYGNEFKPSASVEVGERVARDGKA